jgi:hypothetical protein
MVTEPLYFSKEPHKSHTSVLVWWLFCIKDVQNPKFFSTYLPELKLNRIEPNLYFFLQSYNTAIF